MFWILGLLCSLQQNNTAQLKNYYVTELPSKSSEPVEYIIITTEELVSEYEVLKEWKIEKGINCVIKTVNWITLNYPGSDTPEKIRSFIKSAYYNWDTRWVLLGGDPKIVPTRLAISRHHFLPFYLIPCDMYYSALNGTWNADGDNLWGEVTVDSVNFNPLVYISRFPGSTPEEANKIIFKTIAYEKSPAIDCLERLLLLTYQGQTSAVRSIINYFPDYFIVDTLWDASKNTILAHMANGYGFVFGAFHGAPGQSWPQGGGNISRPDADKMTAPLYSVNAISCNTHQIELDCLSRHFMFNPSISCLGSSRVGWFPEETALNRSYYSAVFDSFYTIGQALAYAKTKIIPDANNDGTYRDVMLSYNLYGDPELKFWTKKPEELQVTYPLSIKSGEEQIKVIVKDKGSPISEAMVCIYRKNETYGKGYTNTQGELIFSIVSETRGDLKLVVTKTDFLPYEGYIFVQPEYAYLKYKSYTTDKDAEPGRDITLSVSIENTGMIKAFDVFTKLICPSLYITLLDTNCQYGDFSSGEIKSRDYAIKINNSCPDTIINFELFVYSTIDSSKDTFNLPVSAPKISHYSHYIDSSGYVSIKIKNSGTGIARDIDATLSSYTAGVSITDSIEHLGNISKGITSFENCFKFNTTALNPVFILRLKDFLSNEQTDTFIHRTIFPPSGLYTEAKSSGVLVGWVPVPSAYAYNVYRMPDSLLVNSYPVNGVYSCEDKQVTPFTGYSYCVTSLDNSLNESDFSQPVFGRSTPALKPGWPKRGKNAFVNSPGIGDIAPDNIGLEVIASFDLDENLYGWSSDGKGILSEDGIFRANLGISWTAPVLADIDADGEIEIIKSESWTDNPRLWVLKQDGSICPNFPVTLTGCTGYQAFSSPSVYDLDNDGKLEIIIPSGTIDSIARIYVFREDGSGFLNPDGIFAECEHSSIGFIGSTIGITTAVADINGDSTIEIIAGFSGNLHIWESNGAPAIGWPVALNGIPSSPAVGDIDSAYPGLEILIHTSGNIIYAFHCDGTPVNGWPCVCNTNVVLMSSPALGNIDEDKNLEIALFGTNTFYLWKCNGTKVSGWPISMPFMNAICPSCPLLADVDGDDKIEYVGISLYDGNIHAFESCGTTAPGFPITANGMIQATPVIIDMDADGKNELLAGTWDYNLKVWDIDGSKIEWGGIAHDRWHTGTYGFVPYDTILTGIEETDYKFKTIKLNIGTNPVIQSTVINYKISIKSKVSIKMYDISGRNIKTLIDEEMAPGAYNIKLSTQEFKAGVYFIRFCNRDFKCTKKLILLK